MIQRIQIYKLDEANSVPAVRDHRAQVLAQELASVRGAITAHVGFPADAASARSWDVSVVMTFADLLSADTFLSSGAYRDALSRALGPAVVVEKGWTFQVVQA
jgi:hypothetical protein